MESKIDIYVAICDENAGVGGAVELESERRSREEFSNRLFLHVFYPVGVQFRCCFSFFYHFRCFSHILVYKDLLI